MQESVTVRLYLSDKTTHDIYDVYQVTYNDDSFYFALLDGRSLKIDSARIVSMSLREPGGPDDS